MKAEIDTRLQELKVEYKKGEERLHILEQEVMNVKQSMLRISGAIQVLEELLKNNEVESNGVVLQERIAE